MVSKFDFKFDPTKDNASPQNRGDDGRCEVYGCPWAGTIHSGSSRSCRYHFRKKGSSLSHITLMLKNHADDFHWYEFILSRTLVDFAVGEIEQKAPSHLRVLPNETFKDYRERVKKYIDDLLEVKSRLLEVAP